MWKVIFMCLALACCSTEAAKRLRAGEVASSFMAKRSVDAPKPTVHEVLQLSPDEDIQSQRSMMTVRGSLKTRYQETYKGVPIYGSVITADDQDPSDVEGTFVQEIHQDLSDVTPALSSQDALEIAKGLEGDSKTTNEEAKLYIYTHEGKARLIYETNYLVESDDKVSRPFYMIDAKTGESIDNWQGIESHQMSGVGGNTKIGKYYYGTEYPHLETTSSDGRNCVLQNKNVKVIHMNFGTSESRSHQVKCGEGANDEINGAYSPAHDALYFGGVVFDMFKEWYNTAPLTMSLVMRVHYKSRYENAFWDGRQMTFGDGGSRFHPLVCLDVTAHEVSHGFTQQNSNLRYKYQSGGMNEAFSDMSGETAEYYSRNGKNDWKMGYDIFKEAGKALRYMDNPEKDGRSIGHASKYTSRMDVHHSSGVYNKMFYTLSMTTGWNPRKAFEVMVRANQMYWGQDSTFEEGATGVLKAAKDLGYNEGDIKNAFSVVGVSVGGTTPPNPTSGPNPTDGPSGSAIRLHGNVNNLRGSTGSSKHYYVDVKNVLLYVRTYRGRGNPDLYIKKGSLASPTNYDYKSTNDGVNEFVYAVVQSGRYYVSVYAKGSYSGVTLMGFSS